MPFTLRPDGTVEGLQISSIDAGGTMRDTDPSRDYGVTGVNPDGTLEFGPANANWGVVGEGAYGSPIYGDVTVPYSFSETRDVAGGPLRRVATPYSGQARGPGMAPVGGLPPNPGGEWAEIMRNLWLLNTPGNGIAVQNKQHRTGLMGYSGGGGGGGSTREVPSTQQQQAQSQAASLEKQIADLNVKIAGEPDGPQKQTYYATRNQLVARLNAARSGKPASQPSAAQPYTYQPAGEPAPAGEYNYTVTPTGQVSVSVPGVQAPLEGDQYSSRFPTAPGPEEQRLAQLGYVDSRVTAGVA